jgi:hypothetical protein
MSLNLSEINHRRRGILPIFSGFLGFNGLKPLNPPLVVDPLDRQPPDEPIYNRNFRLWR